MAIRDVKEVDGVPLTGTRDVRATLRTLPASQVADRMKSYNARYNIGRITRDINEPTLALLVLDATHRDRFKFKADKPRQAGDRRLVPLSFKERERPTLIRSTAGKPIYTSGELMVEPESGRIWQSTLNASVDAIQVQLTTEYSFDERLGLLLPTVFRERYEQGTVTSSRGSGRPTITPNHEVVVAEGRYSNFRRFEVLSRIRWGARQAAQHHACGLTPSSPTFVMPPGGCGATRPPASRPFSFLPQRSPRRRRCSRWCEASC